MEIRARGRIVVMVRSYDGEINGVWYANTK